MPSESSKWAYLNSIWHIQAPSSFSCILVHVSISGCRFLHHRHQTHSPSASQPSSHWSGWCAKWPIQRQNIPENHRCWCFPDLWPLGQERREPKPCCALRKWAQAGYASCKVIGWSIHSHLPVIGCSWIPATVVSLQPCAVDEPLTLITLHSFAWDWTVCGGHYLSWFQLVYVSCVLTKGLSLFLCPGVSPRAWMRLFFSLFGVNNLPFFVHCAVFLLESHQLEQLYAFCVWYCGCNPQLWWLPLCLMNRVSEIIPPFYPAAKFVSHTWSLWHLLVSHPLLTSFKLELE